MAAVAATAATKGNGGGSGRAGGGEGSGLRKKKGPGPVATAYLVIYNVVMTAGWLVIAVGFVRAYLAKGSYHSLYYSIEKPLKFFQTGALLEVQSEDSVLLFVIAWTITEIIRYSFYTFSLLNHLPYIIKWARYTFFIVLYPMGVSGELLTIYAALPFVRQAGLYSISLPNKYNFSFDYYAFLILVMISYIPLFPQLYFHMLHQRRKVLSRTEEHKKFD
ncbi:Very-long-chain (3R)-3-hydroxyacyl-CoA dehydratase 2 [Microtus ochrogaster]|uniref:Very-long-chain (3R)-3-hydroxyacyl-CoA dehydratase n=1 Tax=Microtus ochrogaster TaxID=79684 RepID=A0A8J6G4R0_MICOH|nr:Very-long-chain (3R)-3-hydroxyacyl-CoA dehydratase 2 [Microtus ochrogaster]